MLGFLPKPSSRLQRIIVAFLNCNCNCRPDGGSHGSPRSFLNSFSTLSPTSSSSTADFLRTSLGLSPESALAAARTIGREPKPNSEAVIALFRRYEFSSDQIAEILGKNSQLFWSDAAKTLEPKLQFLSENGFSRKNLALVVSADPFILNRSMEKHIKPCIGLLKSFYGSTAHVVSLFLSKHGTRAVHQFSEEMEPNIQTLRRHGVPDTSIEKLLVLRPRALARNVDQFAETVREAKRIGLSTLSLMFIHGILSLTGITKDKWASKIDVFKGFGWSEEEVRALIVRQPQVMDASEERLKRALDFLSSELKWGPEEFSKYPTALLLSLEKRIKPRTAVLQHLVSKNLVQKKSVGGAFLIADDKFMKRFVLLHQADAPRLRDLYQNKVGADVVCNGD